LRLIFRATVGVALLLTLAVYGTTASSQELLPDASAAKAKQVLQQTINALGGQAYLNVHQIDCEGRVAQFGSNEEVMGFTQFHDLWSLPDKNRTEYISKGQNPLAGYLFEGFPMFTHGGVLITVYNGSEGWLLDKSGVTAQPEDLIKNFTDQVKTGMNNMLRTGVNQPGVELRYAGTDVIDLKQAEWIEITDAEHREMRLAVDMSTHLPIRWVVATRNPQTRERTETSTSYGQYVLTDGVRTPLSVVRARNDKKISQTFLNSCKYNSDLQPQLFTRASLDRRSPKASK
jgi:hypothetical protein